MSLSKGFGNFCKAIRLDSLSDMESTAGDIAKRLNNYYYELDGDSESHMYIVGSIDRKTAIAGGSDLDILSNLPNSVYKKYNNYKNSGQSALVQGVKRTVQERYPNSDVNGDRQVVVIAFNKCTAELVPGFKRSDDRFKYPDTHDGSSRRHTDPLGEQDECENYNSDSNGTYYDSCHILRSWKNTIGFEVGGLLIDTLIYNFSQGNEDFKDSSTDDYLKILTDLYKYLENQNPDQSYWFVVRGNRQVSDTGNGVFVSKAEKVIWQT